MERNAFLSSSFIFLFVHVYFLCACVKVLYFVFSFSIPCRSDHSPPLAQRNDAIASRHPPTSSQGCTCCSHTSGICKTLVTSLLLVKILCLRDRDITVGVVRFRPTTTASCWVFQRSRLPRVLCRSLTIRRRVILGSHSKETYSCRNTMFQRSDDMALLQYLRST